MKKTSKIILFVLVVVALLCGVYRLANKAPSASLESNAQMAEIIESSGCMACHTANPELPFYAGLPVAGKLVKEDIRLGYRSFDMAPMVESLQKGEKVSEVDLAKVEKVIADGTMPLAKYYLVHWGSSVSDTEKQMALAWVKSQRTAFYPNPLADAQWTNEAIRPVQDSVAVDMRKVILGNLLFHDVRLSADNTVSCSSCHGLNTGGVDNKAFSEGVGGQLGGVNAPTVYNALYNFVQFWDGRAVTLADQAAGPPLNPVEMACNTFPDEWPPAPAPGGPPPSHRRCWPVPPARRAILLRLRRRFPVRRPESRAPVLLLNQTIQLPPSVIGPGETYFPAAPRCFPGMRARKSAISDFAVSKSARFSSGFNLVETADFPGRNPLPFCRYKIPLAAKSQSPIFRIRTKSTFSVATA